MLSTVGMGVLTCSIIVEQKIYIFYVLTCSIIVLYFLY